ncbi:MAG: ATP-binding protein [Thermodesulfovibrionales bacterium]|nr:ATP-binding protein [Thermodesulfovibrionales bacterium]
MNKGLINSISLKNALIITAILTVIAVLLTCLLFYQKTVISIETILLFSIVFFIISSLITTLRLYFFFEKPLLKDNKDISHQSPHINVSEEYLINTEKLASLGKMAAGIVHEINSPLTGIITFSHLILKRMPKDRLEDIEDLKIIISQAERCSRFVSGLLSFSRQGMSQKDYVNINKLIEDTISILKNQMRFQNINFVVKYDNNLPNILIDENQIQQVFINILLNAADAVNEKGTITITTSTKEIDKKRYVEASFQDTGYGIERQHLDKIFEPFFTTKPKGQGTGLGLAVCNNIVRKHGGYISIRSEQGEGATFFVGLPIV